MVKIKTVVIILKIITNSCTVRKRISEYNKHPSIKDIKANYKEIFNFPKASTEDINKIIKSLNHREATLTVDFSRKLTLTICDHFFFFFAFSPSNQSKFYFI